MDTATLLQAIYKAYREHRVDDILGFLDEDFRYVVHLPEAALPGGDKPRNKAETAETIERINATYDLLAYDPGPIIATADTATVQPHIRIRDKQTGKELETKLTHTWRVSGGKAIALEERHDVLKVEAFIKSLSRPGAKEL
jgi:ketosteroid isomerase-like protein